MELIDNKSLKIKRLALRQCIYFFQNEKKFQNLKILSNKNKDKIKELYLKSKPEGLLTEIFNETFL